MQRQGEHHARATPSCDSAELLAEKSSLINCFLGRAGVLVLRTGSSITACSRHARHMLPLC